VPAVRWRVRLTCIFLFGARHSKPSTTCEWHFGYTVAFDINPRHDDDAVVVHNTPADSFRTIPTFQQVSVAGWYKRDYQRSSKSIKKCCRRFIGAVPHIGHSYQTLSALSVDFCGTTGDARTSLWQDTRESSRRRRK
jgi:hypothetical protein